MRFTELCASFFFFLSFLSFFPRQSIRGLAREPGEDFEKNPKPEQPGHQGCLNGKCISVFVKHTYIHTPYLRMYIHIYIHTYVCMSVLSRNPKQSESTILFPLPKRINKSINKLIKLEKGESFFFFLDRLNKMFVPGNIEFRILLLIPLFGRNQSVSQIITWP